MKLAGKVHKVRGSSMWLAEIPLLDLMTQADSKEETCEMVKDAIESLVNKRHFAINAQLVGSVLCVEANDVKQLVSLILKRQRNRNHLTLDDVQERLGARSKNEYAQYEQGKALPGLEKLERLLKAIDPKHSPVLGYI